ncbi:MAG: aminoglycoside phosphotransferase family protein [Candidatus Promineofilum sp.]|nr:aminoglycoside phosphotransferase family protein [Promineifilum sp.]
MHSHKMHPDELDIDILLVSRLLTSQFPHLAHLPLSHVPSSGTDHALFRLGEELGVRLPRIHWATEQAELERRWLPRLASHLPLAVPQPIEMGEPGAGYPYRWAIYRWLVGENAAGNPAADSAQTATDLAHFIWALQAIDPTDGPRPDPAGGRGAPLVSRDVETRRAIAASHGLVDMAAVTAAWEAALRAPAHDGPPVWVHGDLEPGNLLLRDGRLSAVIDFCCLAVGDPAVDLIPAWSVFTGAARAAFRAALGVDDAAWARGRGWALSTALIALPYYVDSNPFMAANARRKISAVLGDPASSG